MAAAFASARLEATTERAAGRSGAAFVFARLAFAVARFLGKSLGLGLQPFAGSLVAAGRPVVKGVALVVAIAVVVLDRPELSA